MDWHEFVTSDPAVLVGKPIIRGTRLSVEFLLGLLAGGWTPDQVLAQYPQLSSDALKAALAFAAEAVQHESIHPLRPDAA